MKAILEFNLSEERTQFDEAINGFKWASLVYDIDTYLRANTKYASDDMPDEVYKALQGVRDYLHEEMTNMGLQFE